MGAILSVGPEGFQVFLNGKVLQQGTSVDVETPGAIQSDVTITHGPQSGQTVAQIFKVEGDVLFACSAQPGAPRPTEFKSIAGSGHSLSVWLRTGEADAPQTPATALNWRFWLIIIAAWTATGAARGLQKDLGLEIWYWPGLLFATLLTTVVITLVCLALKTGWRAAVMLGVSLAVGMHTFEELRSVLEPTLGSLGTIMVSGSTAGVATILLTTVFTRLLASRNRL